MSLTDNQNNIKPGDEWWRWRDSNDRLCRSHAWPPHTSDREMAATTTAARNCLAVRHALAGVSLGCQIISVPTLPAAAAAAWPDCGEVTVAAQSQCWGCGGVAPLHSALCGAGAARPPRPATQDRRGRGYRGRCSRHSWSGPGYIIRSC